MVISAFATVSAPLHHQADSDPPGCIPSFFSIYKEYTGYDNGANDDQQTQARICQAERNHERPISN